MPINVDGSILTDQITREFEYNSVIKQGLLCYLDARIFSTISGTTWYDLSGNSNHGTLINGPTYSSVNDGVITLDGSNDYIDIDLDLRSTDYTIFGAARYVVVTPEGRTFSGKNNNWLMGHWSGTTENHYAVGWVTPVDNGPADTNWRFYTATNTGDTWSFYSNNTLVSSNTGGSDGPNGFSIGRYAPGNSEYSNSQIGMFLVYNRVLSSDEMTHTYNLFKSRYGL